MLLEAKTSGPIDVDFGNLQLLQSTSTIKLDPMKIEEKILLSPFDFVNYIEIKMPEKEAKLQKDVFPLKIYESEKKSKFTFCELNPKKELSTKLYTELNAVIFYMVLEDKLIFGDNLSNIKFYSLKENKVIKTLQYPLKNTPEIYKSYAMDISPDEIFSFVGYENGQIALFEKVKCKQIIKTGNNFSIINIKLYHQTKKQLQILYSDIKGNVMLVSLKAKTFGNFEEQMESICKGNVNAPYYLINILKFKDTETVVNKSLKDLNDTFALVSSENVVLYTYNEDFNKIHTFKKPKYIRDNSLPDVVIGLGKQPSNNESTDGDADLLVLYLISWEKVIYLHVLPFMNNTLDFVIDSGFYVNEAPIIKIGFLNLSTIYLIDIEGNFKILSSRKFNQGLISIDEKKRIPIIPENNKNAELQEVIKIGKMKSHSYLNNKQLETYIYSIIDNRKKNEFYAFGLDTIYQQYLINYQACLEKIIEKGTPNDWNDAFLLGQNIYKGKNSSLFGIPMKIDERKKKVKEYLQSIIQKYLISSLKSNQVENNMETIIEFCNEVDLDNFLFEKILKENNLKEHKNIFFEYLEPFILCNKYKDVEVPKNILLELIQFHKDKNELSKLDHLLIHFNVKSLNNNDIKKKLEELDLISPQIYIEIYDKKDFYKPVTIIYDKYSRAEKLDSFKDYKDLIKSKKMPLEKIKTYKQYIGHKLLWYLQKTLDGKKFPSFIESIDPILYFSTVTKITYWLLSEKVFKDLIFLEIGTFFNIINFIFSNEDIIETFEENNEDPTKKAEALKILKQDGNNSYTSENVDASDLINYIVNMGNDILKKDPEKNKKINLYLKIFIIAVGKRIKLNVNDKREAIKFVIQNSSKFKTKIDLAKKMINILEGKDFEIKDYDDILYIMKKGTFDEIRLFLLKKKKLYIDCLHLLLDSEVKMNKLDEIIFTFINMTLTRLQIKKMTNEYKTFKNEVKKNLVKITQKSLENSYTIINFWFPKDKKGCLNQLKEVPQIQLDYVEYSIRKIIKEKENKDVEYVEEEYTKYLLERHVQLLCNLNKKNQIITWLKRLNDYPIKECIEICKKGDVYDALIFLYKKEGNITEALNVCNKIIAIAFDDIIKNYKLKDFSEELYDKKKKEFIKFINDAIETIEFEENSYNKETEKGGKENKHELWGKFLKKLYEIQNSFSKESNIPPEKKEIYKNISYLILNQIQSLITRMSPYVGERNVFDYVIKVNPKAKVIEFKPFFHETLKSYGIEKNILNFFIEALSEYSLDEEFTLETLNSKGNYFSLNHNYCHVCNIPFNVTGTSNKVIRFKCGHMQHVNCCTQKRICLKCLEDNYKKWASRMKDENSKDVDEKEFVEFLKTYQEVKTEMGHKKEKKEKREKNTGSVSSGFYKNFKKLTNIDKYDSKNRRNFIVDGVKFYMNK